MWRASSAAISVLVALALEDTVENLVARFVEGQGWRLKFEKECQGR